MSPLDVFFSPANAPTAEAAALSLILAFVLGQAIATVYMWTFRGMSYSRSFVVAITVGGIVAAMLMLAINNSIAAGLGIAGSLAIIRFRTAMRDPRDMVFVFASLGAGIATGLRAWGPAVAGTLIFCLVSIMLTWTEFGSQRRFDGLLRLQLPATADAERAIAAVLQRTTRSFALVTLREVAQGEAMQYAYQVRLPARLARGELIRAVEAIGGASDVSLILQDPTLEI
ncbi:MAG: DUF4956 domain-containing protein [Deltaproteobacteria bacterium]|nr:MAG: DUF4956 domain-containing protein [Deltaproteobacteria bacterium]